MPIERNGFFLKCVPPAAIVLVVAFGACAFGAGLESGETDGIKAYHHQRFPKPGQPVWHSGAWSRRAGADGAQGRRRFRAARRTEDDKLRKRERDLRLAHKFSARSSQKARHGNALEDEINQAKLFAARLKRHQRQKYAMRRLDFQKFQMRIERRRWANRQDRARKRAQQYAEARRRTARYPNGAYRARPARPPNGKTRSSLTPRWKPQTPVCRRSNMRPA